MCIPEYVDRSLPRMGFAVAQSSGSLLQPHGLWNSPMSSVFETSCVNVCQVSAYVKVRIGKCLTQRPPAKTQSGKPTLRMILRVVFGSNFSRGRKPQLLLCMEVKYIIVFVLCKWRVINSKCLSPLPGTHRLTHAVFCCVNCKTTTLASLQPTFLGLQLSQHQLLRMPFSPTNMSAWNESHQQRFLGGYRDF